jgi:hypothetical protein
MEDLGFLARNAARHVVGIPPRHERGLAIVCRCCDDNDRVAAVQHFAA